MIKKQVNWNLSKSNFFLIPCLLLYPWYGYFYRPQTKFAKVRFHRCLSAHRGACVVAPRGRGHVWLLLGRHVWFYSGGMCGFYSGACMVLFGGHAWFYSGGHVWFYSGGVHGFIGGHVWFYSGECMVLFGGHAWFYLGGVWFYSGAMHGFIWGVCMDFSVFSDTMRYGQWAGSTHPTGMHSCFYSVFLCFMFTIFSAAKQKES